MHLDGMKHHIKLPVGLRREIADCCCVLFDICDVVIHSSRPQPTNDNDDFYIINEEFVILIQGNCIYIIHLSIRKPNGRVTMRQLII